MGKKIFGARIDEDLVKAFKRAVLSKWGKIHGGLGFEVSAALAKHLTNDLLHTHTHIYPITKSPMKGSKSLKTTELIYNELRIRHPSNTQVTLNQVFEAVDSIVSAEPRMHQKYLQMLHVHGYLENVGIGVFGLAREKDRQLAREFIGKVEGGAKP